MARVRPFLDVFEVQPCELNTRNIRFFEKNTFVSRRFKENIFNML